MHPRPPRQPLPRRPHPLKRPLKRLHRPPCRPQRFPPKRPPLITTAAATLRLPDLKGRTVVAVTENAYTPLNFVDPATGKAVGWEYDAVNEICRRLNCVVDWKLSSWDAMIPAVKDGQFDVGMDGITINDERKTQVDFSDPYMISQQFMLVRADETRFADAKTFGADRGAADRRAGRHHQLLRPPSTTCWTATRQNPRIKLFETFGASVQALLAGDVDMVLMDAASGRGYVGANPDKLKIVGEALGSEDFGFIFTPKSDLVAPFNAAIAQMKADGYLDYLNNRWFFLADPARQGHLRRVARPEGADGGGGDGERLHAAQLRRPRDR